LWESGNGGFGSAERSNLVPRRLSNGIVTFLDHTTDSLHPITINCVCARFRDTAPKTSKIKRGSAGFGFGSVGVWGSGKNDGPAQWYTEAQWFTEISPDGPKSTMVH
jgi:hypothetical protein